MIRACGELPTRQREACGGNWSSALLLDENWAVIDAIEAAGATVLYLPPYGSDYNPIGMIWSKVKGVLRSIAA